MTATTAVCPLCHQASHRIHSRYLRTLADLPWARIPVRVRVRVRRFFCDQPDCQRRIFTERLDPAIAPYARRTRRLDTLLQAVASALSGKRVRPSLNTGISPPVHHTLVPPTPDARPGRAHPTRLGRG